MRILSSHFIISVLQFIEFLSLFFETGRLPACYTYSRGLLFLSDKRCRRNSLSRIGWASDKLFACPCWMSNDLCHWQCWCLLSVATVSIRFCNDTCISGCQVCFTSGCLCGCTVIPGKDTLCWGKVSTNPSIFRKWNLELALTSHAARATNTQS